MYVLIPKSRLKTSGNVTFHNTVPDGRAIVHISELKAIGSVVGVDIFTTKRELSEFIDSQNESGLYPGTPDINQGESVGDGSVTTPTPDQGGTDNPLGQEEQPPQDTDGGAVTDTPTVLPELDSSTEATVEEKANTEAEQSLTRRFKGFRL